MNLEPMNLMKRMAALLLLVTPALPTYATAMYDVSIYGDLTIDTVVGSAPLLTQTNKGSLINTDNAPPIYSQAAAESSATPFTTNTLRILSSVSGFADTDGANSSAQAERSAGYTVTNNGNDSVTLLATVDVSWAWTLLVDDVANEFASNIIGLEIYIDDPLNPFAVLVNQFNQTPPTNSDSANFTWQLDVSDSLAILEPGQTREIWVRTSAAGVARTIPEPGTLWVMMIGLAGLGGIRRRVAI